MSGGFLLGLVVLSWSCTGSSTAPAQVDELGNAPDDSAQPPREDTSSTPRDTGVPLEELDEDLARINGDTGYPDSRWVYSDTVVHEFQLFLTQDAIEALSSSPWTYVEGAFSEGDDYYSSVGIRLKGSSTYRPITGKPSFKLKFNYSLPEQRFYGLRHLTLHAMIYDPSMMAEYLSYGVFREAGVPAPRIGYAHVTLGDQDYGFYAIIETMDKDFIEGWWNDTEGTMWESEGCDFSRYNCYDVEEQGDDSNEDDLLMLVKDMNLDGREMYEAVKERVDWDEVMTYLAVEIVVAHWDGYAENVNNYFLYHEPSLDKWYFTPWSCDLAWAWYPWSSGSIGDYRWLPSDYTKGMFASECWGYQPCFEDLTAKVMDVAKLLEGMPISEQMDELYERIHDYVYADPRKEYSNDEFEQQVEDLRDWIAERPANIRSYWEMMGSGK